MLRNSTDSNVKEKQTLCDHNGIKMISLLKQVTGALGLLTFLKQLVLCCLLEECGRHTVCKFFSSDGSSCNFVGRIKLVGDLVLIC